MSSNLEKIADMHCHIVPGVDDGAQTLDESLAIIKEEYAQGVRMIILTPHWRRGMFETDRQTVKRQFQKLKESAEPEFPDLDLFLGCEFHVNPDMIDEIRSSELFRMNGTDYVLTEFSAEHTGNFIRETVNLEVSSGYTPIIAHIERYPACFGDPELVQELKKMGALIQVNADTVAGREGWAQKRAILRFLKMDLVDFIGSDAHNIRDRACHLLECEKVLCKKFGPEMAHEILWENPNRIISSHSKAGQKSPDDKTEDSKKIRHKPVTIHLDL